MNDPGRGPWWSGRPDDVPCRIALWGTFDTGALGDALVLQILRRELAARLPLAQILPAAPIGSHRPTPGDGGEPAAPLGPWSPERAAGLAAEVDCVVVAATALFPDPGDVMARYRLGEPAAAELAPDRFFVEGPGEGSACPAVWYGVRLETDPSPEQASRLRSVAGSRTPITVSDEATRRRMRAAGVEAELAVAPDPALLAARLHTPELLAKRLDYLRLMGWYPPGGAPLLVEGGAALLGQVPALAAAIEALRGERPGLGVVVAEMGAPGDDEFAASLRAALGDGTYHLPGVAGLEDRCSAIAACGVFAGTSARGALVALSHGRPQVVIGRPLPARRAGDPLEAIVGITADPSLLVRRPADLSGALSLALATPASPGWLARLTRQVDAALDSLAGVAAAATRQRRGAHRAPDAARVRELEAQLATLQTAHEARSRRLAAERMVFANHLRKAEEEILALKAESARLREETSRTLARVAQAEAALRQEAAARAAAIEELLALRATRTFRYTAELRSAYGRLRKITSVPEQPEHP